MALRTAALSQKMHVPNLAVHAAVSRQVALERDGTELDLSKSPIDYRWEEEQASQCASRHHVTNSNFCQE